MIRARSLSTRVLEEMLDRARGEQPTYAEVGTTISGGHPGGYRHDRCMSAIGGRDDFSRAREGLSHWQAHLGAGARVFPSDPVERGGTVLILLGMGPLQVVAPCRVVHVIDEEDRFGFAYGTLPGHPEQGEELFVIERGDGGCTFRITAFSRPDQILVRLGGAVARRVQKRVTHRYLRSLGHYVRLGRGTELPGVLTGGSAVLVYDGACGVCTSSARWIAARWTDAIPARALPWQDLGAGGLDQLGLTIGDVSRAAWWVAEGRASGGHLAVARALVAAGGGWGLTGRVLLVPPMRWFAAVGYRVVARYRHRLPGGTAACQL